MGGGTKTTTNNTPWAPAQPYILNGLQSAGNVFQQQQPALNQLTGNLSGSVIPQINQQLQQTGQQMQPGFNYINSTLSPGFLQNGQQQAQQLGQFAGQQAGNSINSAFSSAGRTGSGNNVTDTARGVTQAELAPMLQNYQYNEGIQQGTLSQLPGMAAAQYSGYTPLLAAYQSAAQLPYSGLNSYAGVLGGLAGNYGTSTQQQSGGMLNNLLGAGAMLGSAAIMSSDRRLKTNLKLLGRAKDGLGVWEWNWKSDPNGERTTGVMADEVKALRPHAYVPNYRNGYDGVNYAALGSLA